MNTEETGGETLTAANQAGSPFAAMMERVIQASSGRLAVRTGHPSPSGAEWVSLDQLAFDSPERIHDLVGRASASLETADHRPAASFLLKSWCRHPVLFALGCYVSEQRVPDLSAANLEVRLGENGFVEEVAIRENQFAALPDDPDAGHPEALIVDSQDELRDYLFDTLIHSHLEPVIETLRPAVPFGRRFMWATVADTIAGVLLIVGEHLNRVEFCRQEAETMASRPPLKGKTGCRAVEIAGQSDIVLRRGCCCFAYRTTQYGHCKTCPLLSEAEQDRRLAEDTAKQPAG